MKKTKIVVKVGDILDLNPDVKVKRETMIARLLTETYGTEPWRPILVNTVEECDGFSSNCEPVCNYCPGMINGRCFGFNEGYYLKPIGEWDREEN